MVSILYLIRCSVNVYFIPENTRSGSDNIAGTENTSIAILDRNGSLIRYSESSYQLRAVLLFYIRDNSLRYCSSLSLLLLLVNRLDRSYCIN